VSEDEVLRRLILLLITIQLAGASTCSSAEESASKERIARLIRQLGDESFKEREAATSELHAIGEPALEHLRTAAASNDDAEIRLRASQIVGGILARRLEIAAKQELDKLQGTWHSMSTEANGAPLIGENKADKHHFSGDKVTYEDGGRVMQIGKVTIVEIGDNFVKIDFQITGGYRPGDTWVGIYELHGDELKWCGGYTGDGVGRPTAFGTKSGDGFFLRSLKRDAK
jgi:uncharacterized protein (TIGR03067 family)